MVTQTVGEEDHKRDILRRCLGRAGYSMEKQEEAAYQEGYRDAKAYLEAGVEIERMPPQLGDEISNAYRRGWNAAHNPLPQEMETRKEYAGHHRSSRPEETFRTLEEKLKGIETPEEFDEVQNWWMREIMRLGPIMRKIENISLEKYGVPPTTTKLFLKVRGESLILYKRGNITLEATGIPVLFLLKEDEEALDIFRNIVNFIDRKYPGEDLEIRVGRQPISVAGREGFRVGIPPKEAPISMMFPYSMEVLHAFEELERRGHPSRILWATMDFFHELGHTKGITDEKECDRFALELTKEYLRVGG